MFWLQILFKILDFVNVTESNYFRLGVFFVEVMTILVNRDAIVQSFFSVCTFTCVSFVYYWVY